MGLFDRFRSNARRREIKQFFEMVPMYQPVFTTYDGGLYEMMLVRAAIHSFATHVSKLKPQIEGGSDKAFERILQFLPNPIQDTTTFLYQIATIYKVQNNVLLLPMFDEFEDIVIGYYPLLPTSCKVKEYDGIYYLEYRSHYGLEGIIELEKVGILSQMNYTDPLFGENNRALDPYMQVLMTQNEGIVEGIKNSASLRFLAKLAQPLQPKNLKEEQKRFREMNLSSDNDNGVALFDSKYESVEQIKSQAMLVNPAQLREIKEHVYSYFGTSDEIIQNKYTNSAIWTAYYEGEIEAFAIKLSLVMTNMTYSLSEIVRGTSILWTANRIQYATNEEKINIVSTLFDRGLLNKDDAREVFNMAPLPNGEGEKYFIRLDYAEVNELNINEEGKIDAVQTSEPGISDDDDAAIGAD